MAWKSRMPPDPLLPSNLPAAFRVYDSLLALVPTRLFILFLLSALPAPVLPGKPQILRCMLPRGLLHAVLVQDMPSALRRMPSAGCSMRAKL